MGGTSRRAANAPLVCGMLRDGYGHGVSGAGRQCYSASGPPFQWWCGLPVDGAILPNLNLVVCDNGNHRVQVVKETRLREHETRRVYQKTTLVVREVRLGCPGTIQVLYTLDKCVDRISVKQPMRKQIKASQKDTRGSSVALQ